MIPFLLVFVNRIVRPARVAAKSAFGARGGDETPSNSAEGDCRTAFAMTVNRECNSIVRPARSRASFLVLGEMWYNAPDITDPKRSTLSGRRVYDNTRSLQGNPHF
jgi:hypothetical protein